jgi:hypothetical protein
MHAKNNIDLGREFQTLIDWTFQNYHGCLIERKEGQFKVFGKMYPTLEAAKAKIDEPITFKNDNDAH